MKTKEDKISIGLLLVGITLTLLSFYVFLSKTERNFLNISSIIGTIASIIGLSIAYFQISATKNISFETRKQVNQLLLLSESTRATDIINEIQFYLRGEDKKIDLAILRMKDLKKMLSLFKNQVEFENLVSSEKYKELRDNLTIDIKNLSDSIIYKKQDEINFSKILNSLEELSDALNDYENVLKLGK